MNDLQERDRRYLRWLEIPEPIRDLSTNNALLHNFCGRYMVGEIITKEELLCQMVVCLARDWTAMQQRACDAMLAMNVSSMVRDVRGPNKA